MIFMVRDDLLSSYSTRPVGHRLATGWFTHLGRQALMVTLRRDISCKVNIKPSINATPTCRSEARMELLGLL